MEILFEFIITLIFEGIYEGARSEKIPTPIRIIFSVIIVLLFLAVLGIFALIGFVLVKNKAPSNICFGILLFLLDVVFVVAVIRKGKRYLKKGTKKWI